MITIGWLMSQVFVVLGGWLLIKNAAIRSFVLDKVTASKIIAAMEDDPASFHRPWIAHLESPLDLLDRCVEVGEALLALGIVLTIICLSFHWGLVNLG